MKLNFKNTLIVGAHANGALALGQLPLQGKEYGGQTGFNTGSR